MASEIKFTAAVPQFTVPNLVRTAAYYRDVLGFRINSFWDGTRASPQPSGDPVFVIVQRNDVKVFFNRAEVADVRTGRADGAYDVYFHVTGINALALEFRTRGAEILEGPAERIYGQRELVLKDCNGLIIAFGESIPPQRQCSA